MNASTTGPNAALTFVEPILGLDGLAEYTLTPIDDGGVVFALRSVDAPDTRLFLLDPEPFFPDYHPRIAADVVEQLGLDVDDAPAGVLVVITPASPENPHTANLLAPVVFNSATGAAQQVVLDEEWPLRAPLVHL